MQNRKTWLAAMFIVALLGGTAAILNVPSVQTAAAEELPAGDHWRNFDGHWSYWHAADHRWYYTDGTHWYYHNGIGWAVYQFDKLFGRTGFVPGGYHPPPAEKAAVPHHGIFHR
ncbi:MAG TPA: hypothetical protein VIK18_11830 [Pirellulales bacterium]